jgi:hypothetical protein
MNRHARINRRKESSPMNTNEATTEAAAVADQEAPQADALKDKLAASKKASKAAKTAAKTATKKVAKAASKPAGKNQAKPAGKKASKAAAPKAERGQPRQGSKKQIVLDMLRRKDGATLAEIAKATGWQNHSVRGFISTMTKKMDLPIASLKNAAGDRFYRIEK